MSVTILSDELIHRANLEYLDHDYPTDVLSFRLDEPEDDVAAGDVVAGDVVAGDVVAGDVVAGDVVAGETTVAGDLEGEILVSWETAVRESKSYSWAARDECLLYVVHGCLHLVGHDDHDPAKRRIMRQAERSVLGLFGLTPRYIEDESVAEQQETGS